MTPRAFALGYIACGVLWSVLPRTFDWGWGYQVASLLGFPEPWPGLLQGLPAIVATAVIVYLAGRLATRHPAGTRQTRTRFRRLSPTVAGIPLRKRYEECLLHRANYDQLTGLPNRVLAFDRLCQALKQTSRDQRPLTILQVDLDHFKVVNDTLGHDAGDAVLVEATRRLLSCVRKTDTVARLGSDEFVVILAEPNSDEPSDVVARRVLEAFSPPLHVHGTELFVSVSIGLAVAPNDGTDAQSLLQNSSAAMSRAKEVGSNSYRFFTPGMNQQAAERLEIETHLRHALERDELSLVYQPVLDLASNRMTGCEALLRWNGPALGEVSPDRFIPLAEDSGLIVPIGAWVLRQACAEARRWLDQGWDINVAVNTSPRQLRHPKLIDDVKAALMESGLPADRLELEVTETFLIEDPIRTAAVLRELNGLGIRLSIDDFGTGYSSLSYLKRFPFQTLKIDRTFIRDALSDPSDRALVKAIIALAKSLNLRVVAEGVETFGQLDFLRSQGCDVAQGFHYSRPLVPSQASDFARRFAARLPQSPHDLSAILAERLAKSA
ncbi:EAL domain-containing protein [Telmatospirillum sp.]|uniref:putative bifunctional diguanylate cyclase/phosphodiesterase n=1 Tax=Telmatospirillum sp. TaxID=2079197 RepID=UPI00284E53E6|nr:EAL domain-containing protein [Telmatospirillum sp.]MDR3436886.1 EAL domain-containing protein [Telmatospirillum sp.]